MDKHEEYKLTKRDQREIFDLAHREWLNDPEKDQQLALCKAYVKAICGWFKAKGLNVVKGKVIK